MLKYSVTLALFSALLSGQHLSVGAIAGTNLTDDVLSGNRSLGQSQGSEATYVVSPGARHLILGVKLELDLTRSWSIEFDALHRKIESTSRTDFNPPLVFPGGPTYSTFGTSTRLLTPWEFPLLAKYRLPLPRLHPFLLAGPSFRPAGNGTNLSHTGFTAGGGIELNTHGFRVAPSIRYTRWAAKYDATVGSPLLNQVEFLVGIDHPSTNLTSSFLNRRLSAGVILGVGLGDDFKAAGAQKPESNSPIYGLVFEAALFRNFAIEVNGLYRPLHGTEPEFKSTVRFAHLTWEFPVLLKYRLPVGSRWRPFLEGGPSFRAEGNLNLQSVSHFGATLGGGIETNLWRLKIAPTLRYTHWGGAGNSSLSQTWQNQTQALLSLTF